MCEIILIYYIQAHLGEILERKDRDTLAIVLRILFVLCWLFSEFVGAIIGFIANGGEFGPSVIMGMIAGPLFTTAIFYFVAAMIPPAERSRGYMDEYARHRRGRVKKRRRPEEEDRPRRRRREEDVEDDDRPRRRRSEDEEEEEDSPGPRRRDERIVRDEDDRPRPRRRDDRVAREDDDERPRPRRRPKPDEEY